MLALLQRLSARLFSGPTSLNDAVLAQQPCAVPATPRNIDAASVTRWNELAGQPLFSWPRRHAGELLGWRFHAGRYASFPGHCPAIERITTIETIEHWTCDISAIDGFSGSKSDLSAFGTTDEMVAANSREMIDEITPAKLAHNLAHREIRIIHSADTTTDHFMRYAWDGRLFLMNDGGSHHLAAAKYIAARTGAPVPLRAKLRTCSLNEGAIAALRAEYELFAVSDEPEHRNALQDEMCRLRVAYLTHHLPPPIKKARMLLLPRSEPKSMLAAEQLRGAGAVNLGELLSQLLARQRALS